MRWSIKREWLYAMMESWQRSRMTQQAIPQTEAKIAAIEARMDSGEGSYSDHHTWAAEHAALAEELDSLTLRWLELSERV